MGMIRKTLSIGTFGTIAFRSKGEKLQRAERAQREAEVLLEQEHSARSVAEAQTSLARKCLRRAERRNRRNKKIQAMPNVHAVAERATEMVEQLTST